MTRRAFQVIDLGFGDSGKGTIVDYLARRHEADIVVRFNGGPQAGHNVVLPDGRHHTFAQFGSGSLVPNVSTLLSRFMLIEPYAMLNEAAHLASIGAGDVFSRTLIDEQCLVITPPQQIANRVRERARGDNPHGTCGMGVGECMEDSIDHPELSLHAADLLDPQTTRRKLNAVLEFKRQAMQPLRGSATPEELRVVDDPSWIETALMVYAEMAARSEIVPSDRWMQIMRDASCIIFEGAQGVLLDERYGFAPHTTWSKTTFTNADTLLEESQSDVARRRIGISRTYMTRHGIGPFISFDSKLQDQLSEPHNSDHGWQGPFRRGPLDLVMLRYALRACGGVDTLAVTHLDGLPVLPPIAFDAYFMAGEYWSDIPFSDDDTVDRESLGKAIFAAPRKTRALTTNDEAAFLSDFADSLKTPVGYISQGVTYLDKRCIDDKWR